MKKTLLMLSLIGLICSAGCSSSSDPGDEPTPDPKPTPTPDPDPDPEPESDISAYFAKCIGGEEAAYDTSEPIALEAIETRRQAIWDEWCAANNAYDETKLIALRALSTGANGQWRLPNNLEPGATMPYYYGYKGSKPDAGYPFFLYLHGSGDKATEWQYGLEWARYFNDAPSVYFVPQIPNTGDWYRWWLKSKQWAWEKMLRLAFVAGDVDPDRIYYMGISEGAYGSQRLASFYADYLAGAGPIAGGEPLRNAPPENLANLSFCLRTGANDTGFARYAFTQEAKRQLDQLQAAHPGYYNHRVDVVAGADHSSVGYEETTPWLKKQPARNPWPKYVWWENFEMDGRYRDGFYNLYVVERSNVMSGTRTAYEMTVEGNAITLNVRNVSYNVTSTDPVGYGLELTYDKKYTDATTGKVIVYLCGELVDLDQEVTLTVNGREVFRGVPELDAKYMVRSCAAFGDPRRIYPAAIEVDIAQ